MSLMHSSTSTAARPSAFASIGDALSQHAGLRSRLAEMMAVVGHALHEDARWLGRIPALIDEARAAYEEHLIHEEASVLPVLRTLASHHEPVMREDHRRQRRLLSSLAGEAHRAPDVPLLAVKFEFLIHWLLAGMRDEEQVWSSIGSA